MTLQKTVIAHIGEGSPLSFVNDEAMSDESF